MSICLRTPVAPVNDAVIKEGIALFTTPMANMDPKASRAEICVESPTADSEAENQEAEVDNILPRTKTKGNFPAAEDVPPTSVVEDIEKWVTQARGAVTAYEGENSIHYTVLGMLVAYYILIRDGRAVSITNALSVLLYRLTPEQRTLLGMTGDLSNSRVGVILNEFKSAAINSGESLSEVEAAREYGRFAKFVTESTKCFDPSIFPKKHKLTNGERKAIEMHGEVSKLLKKDKTGQRKIVIIRRRIDKETEALHLERFFSVINKIVGASANGAPQEGYKGDLATDETIILTLPWRNGHGFADDKKQSADPDARWWNGKTSKRKDKATNKIATAHKASGKIDWGHGYGVTYAIKMGRPHMRAIAHVAVGIHVGAPTGGRTADFAVALKYASRHGHCKEKNRDSQVIGDMGYSTKDPWAPFLIEQGYKTSMEYPSNWSKDITIDDTNKAGDPAPGPHIIAGLLRCPGSAGLETNQLPRPHGKGEVNYDFDEDGNEMLDPANLNESDQELLARKRRIDFIDSLAMPIKNGLQKSASTTGGRPLKVPKEQTWSITVQCPAAAGLVNCQNKPCANGLRVRGLPDVPNPPYPNDPNLRPRACVSNNITYQLSDKEIKYLQADTLGSFIQEDMYESMRSANERFHSQLKHANSGGVDDMWLEMRGIAKVGLLIAIATAVTNYHLINKVKRSVSPIDGKAKFGPREALRRKRQAVFLKSAQAA